MIEKDVDGPNSLPLKLDNELPNLGKFSAHLAGLVGATVKVTIEIEAEIPDGAPDNVVRTVTENSRTLKLASHGFDRE